MKVINKFLALAITAVAFVFASCSNAEVTVQYFRDKLKGVMPAQYAAPEGRITIIGAQ